MKKIALYFLSAIGFFAILVSGYIVFKVLSGSSVDFSVQNHAGIDTKVESSWSSCEGELVELAQSKGLKRNINLVVFACDKTEKGPQIRVSVLQNSELIEQQTVDVVHIQEMSQGKAFTPVVRIKNKFDIIVSQQAGYFTPSLDSEYYALKQAFTD